MLREGLAARMLGWGEAGETRTRGGGASGGMTQPWGPGSDRSGLFPQQYLARGRCPVTSHRAKVTSTDLEILAPRTVCGFVEGVPGFQSHLHHGPRWPSGSPLPRLPGWGGDDTTSFSVSVKWGLIAEAVRAALGTWWAPRDRSRCQLPPV